MVDITHKSSTLRTAIAQAIVRVGASQTITRIQEGSVPKGDVFAMSKAAGLLGVKKTPELLPDCHPLPIESTAINYSIKDLEIHIEVAVKTIYKTGVEVEAMHGASVVALNMYDMLKPIDKQIEISSIKLLKKRGGKSDLKKRMPKQVTACVVVCSDTISAGKKEDVAGKVVRDKLINHGVQVTGYTIIADEPDQITSTLQQQVAANTQLIIFAGGTGLSKRDITPETLAPLIQRRIPGLEEAIRSYGQDRTPYAMLSRSLAGIVGESLVLALPGSTKGAGESIDAIFPSVLHIFNVIAGSRHD